MAPTPYFARAIGTAYSRLFAHPDRVLAPIVNKTHKSAAPQPKLVRDTSHRASSGTGKTTTSIHFARFRGASCEGCLVVTPGRATRTDARTLVRSFPSLGPMSFSSRQHGIGASLNGNTLFGVRQMISEDVFLKIPQGHKSLKACIFLGKTLAKHRPASAHTLRASSVRTARVASWHEAAVRKCPLLRRLWGLSGHRSASSIYEYTP